MSGVELLLCGAGSMGASTLLKEEQLTRANKTTVWFKKRTFAVYSLAGRSVQREGVRACRIAHSSNRFK